MQLYLKSLSDLLQLCIIYTFMVGCVTKSLMMIMLLVKLQCYKVLSLVILF